LFGFYIDSPDEEWRQRQRRAGLANARSALSTFTVWAVRLKVLNLLYDPYPPRTTSIGSRIITPSDLIPYIPSDLLEPSRLFDQV
jgi:hypothetical protein